MTPMISRSYVLKTRGTVNKENGSHLCGMEITSVSGGGFSQRHMPYVLGCSRTPYRTEHIHDMAAI